MKSACCASAEWRWRMAQKRQKDSSCQVTPQIGWQVAVRPSYPRREHLLIGDLTTGKTVLYEAVLVRIAPLVTSEGNGSFKETALYLGFRKGGGLNAGFEMKGIKPGEVGAYYGSPKWRRGCGRGEIFHPRQQIEDQLRQQWCHSYCRVRIWIVHDHTFRGCSWWELSMRSAQTWDTSALP